MKVVVSGQGLGLDAMSSPVFGRCPVFVFVDTESLQCEGVGNPCLGSGGGAGVQAAQFVIERGAEAVLSLNVGPNAFAVLQRAGAAVYRIEAGTVRQAVEAFVAGRLARVDVPSVGAHRGMRV